MNDDDAWPIARQRQAWIYQSDFGVIECERISEHEHKIVLRALLEGAYENWPASDILRSAYDEIAQARWEAGDIDRPVETAAQPATTIAD